MGGDSKSDLLCLRTQTQPIPVPILFNHITLLQSILSASFESAEELRGGGLMLMAWAPPAHFGATKGTQIGFFIDSK